MTLLDSFKQARRVSTPIVAITTPDPNATIEMLRQYVEGSTKQIPLIRWDICNGMMGLNETGVKVLKKTFGESIRDATANPAECLMAAQTLPGEDQGGTLGGSILFFMNANRYVGKDADGNEAVVQALCNLRDLYKQDRRTLVLLAVELVLPVELAQDVIVLDEPLPDDAALTQVIREQYEAVSLDAPNGAVLSKAVDALRGLSSFVAEQLTAMSLTRNGLDLEALWARKKATIEQTPGLQVDRGEEKMEDIGGLHQMTAFLKNLFAGKASPKVVVRLDEIEKMLSAAGTTGYGDTSGTSQDQLGVILREMEDNGWTGLISVGPPGSGKTLVSKAVGNSNGVLSISLDLGATKSSLVGSSEARIRQAMKVIKSIAGKGGAFFNATCNSLEALPPELRRRFRLGIWYYDLPSREEKDSIWQIVLKKFGMKPTTARPDDTDWTGSDIRNCVDVAWRLGCSLADATQYLVPVAKSDPKRIERLRELADGRFLSASAPGVYQKDAPQSKPRSVGRKVTFN